jgi:hypothetical protein
MENPVDRGSTSGQFASAQGIPYDLVLALSAKHADGY